MEFKFQPKSVKDTPQQTKYQLLSGIGRSNRNYLEKLNEAFKWPYKKLQSELF